VSISTSPALRCPRCSAQVSAGSDWCTLCYADLRPAAPEPYAPVEPSRATEEPPAQQAVARRGKHAKAAPEFGEAAPAPDPNVDALAAEMLGQLAADEARNPLGPLAGLVDTTGKRIALMTGGAAAAIALLVLVMAAIGALL
jgi:hypothetical protein